MKETPRNVWGANELEDIVNRNVVWMQNFIVQAVQALRRDGRPILTEAVPQQEKLTRLLEAPPEFWDALKQSDPAAAAKLVAELIRARAEGKVPQQGPRVGEAIQIEEQQKQDAMTGTQRAHPVPPFITKGLEDTTFG